MIVLENIYYDGKLYRMVLVDRNDNKFTLSYISGNIEIMVDNDSVVVEDVIEAYKIVRGFGNE